MSVTGYARVDFEPYPPGDNWHTLGEFGPEPFVAHPDKQLPPAIVVRQHRDTRELRVDIFDCDGGLDVTYTNGGTTADEKKRHQVWFRIIRTCRKSLRRVSVRFLARGDADNLRLRS